MLGEFLANQDEFFSKKDINQQIEEEIQNEQATIQSRSNLIDEINARRNDTNVIDDQNKELPNIDIDSGSNSNNSLDHFLPEPTPQTNIIEQLNTRTGDSNVVASPNVSQIGLTPILEKVKGLFTTNTESKVLESPDNTLQNKPSISNLLDDTQALFDDLDEDNNISTNIIENIQSNVSDNINDNIPIDTTNNLPDNTTNNLPDNTTNNLPDNTKVDSNYVKNI
jgi:hypothetical protein